MVFFYLSMFMVFLYLSKHGGRESGPEKRFLVVVPWWANPGDPIQLWAIQFIQITVIQFGLHAARPGLAAPGSALDHQPVVIELSPLPLSSSPKIS